MLVVERPRQNDGLASSLWRKRETPRRRVHVGKLPQRPTQAPDFDAQARAMRVIRAPDTGIRPR